MAYFTQFSSNAVTGNRAPATFDFTDDSFTSPLTATPVGWSWNFGDESPLSTVQNPTHVYTTGGSYNVVLTVTWSDANVTSSASPNIFNIFDAPVNLNKVEVTSGNTMFRNIDPRADTLVYINGMLDLNRVHGEAGLNITSGYTPEYGAPISITAGDTTSLTAGVGGSVGITGGTGFSGGGNVELSGGNSDAIGAFGGYVRLYGGSGDIGGRVFLQAGYASSGVEASGGCVMIQGSDGDDTGYIVFVADSDSNGLKTIYINYTGALGFAGTRNDPTSPDYGTQGKILVSNGNGDLPNWQYPEYLVALDSTGTSRFDGTTYANWIANTEILGAPFCHFDATNKTIVFDQAGKYRVKVQYIIVPQANIWPSGTTTFGVDLLTDSLDISVPFTYSPSVGGYSIHGRYNGSPAFGALPGPTPNNVMQTDEFVIEADFEAAEMVVGIFTASNEEPPQSTFTYSALVSVKKLSN